MTKKFPANKFCRESNINQLKYAYPKATLLKSITFNPPSTLAR